MLTLVLVLAGLAPAPLTLDVPIYLGAELSEEIIVSALRETERIFEPGGIELRFDLSPENDSSRPFLTVLVQPRPARFKVHGCSRDRHDHRLGRTQLRSRRITLWSEQVARAVDGNWDRKELADVDDGIYARALGRVLAHELGHLLLRLNGHRVRGLMRSAFSHQSLTGRGRRAFRLAEEDLQAIRNTLLHAVAKNENASLQNGQEMTGWLIGGSAMPPVTPHVPYVDVESAALSEGCPPPRCADHGGERPQVTRPANRSPAARSS